MLHHEIPSSTVRGFSKKKFFLVYSSYSEPISPSLDKGSDDKKFFLVFVHDVCVFVILGKLDYAEIRLWQQDILTRLQMLRLSKLE